MHCFVVFNTRGVVLYQEGEAPVFLNTLIRTLDLKKTYETRRVRDDIMEYAIRGNRVYLLLSDKKTLLDRVDVLEHILSNKPENEMVTEEDLEKVGRKITKQEAKPAQTGKRKESLNYSLLNEETPAEADAPILSSIKKLEFKRVFKLFTGNIDLKDLAKQMKTHLIEKNIDSSYANLLTESVVSECKEEGSEQVSESNFKEKIISVIRKLLPTFDHSAFVEEIRKHPSLYTICFIGVNGVGKSTSLAKVACWLIQNGLKVYIAACDTFRAGAIEQLKIHVERFRRGGKMVGFYESGYAKDDATVAQAAIARATNECYDVLLIDTAGRMHNKENLMKSLSKLIQVNKPNHIVFVGEALLGGDSLQHIKEFNRRIGEGSGNTRINSIILTKVDTVDDKIGQVINLSFSASAPILFLGTGQSNEDLMKLDPSVIAEILTS